MKPQYENLLIFFELQHIRNEWMEKKVFGVFSVGWLSAEHWGGKCEAK